MSIVITGANGHIGNNLVRLLVDKGYNVRVIVRRKDESLDGLDIEYKIGSFYDEELLKESIFEGDIVIHLAAFIDVKNKYKNDCDKINTLGTKIISEFAYKAKVKKFIYISSVDAIYKDNDDPIYEKGYLDITNLKDNYALSKAIATNTLLDFKKEHNDFNLAIIYPSACIGPNDYKPSLIGKVIKDVISGKGEFSIDGHYNFVDVRDVSYSILKVIEYDKEGDYLISGETKTISELYEEVNHALNIKRTKIKIPLFIAYLGIPFVPYLSKFVFKTIRGNTDYRYDKASKELDYKPRSFKETIEDTVLFFKNRGNR